MTHFRFLILPVLACLLTVGAGCHRGGQSNSDQADKEVCSHVQPGPLGAAGDWQDPSVGAIAFNSASPLVRDAYGAAAAVSPPVGASPEQMQTVMAAWGHLEQVCAAVNAR